MQNGNGHAIPQHVAAGAVDLAARKAQAEQQQQINASRDRLIHQQLLHAGLVCSGCGSRIEGSGVVYFVLTDERVDTPTGPQIVPKVNQQMLCSKSCTLAPLAHERSFAHRDGPAGRITWKPQAAEAKHPQSDD